MQCGKCYLHPHARGDVEMQLGEAQVGKRVDEQAVDHDLGGNKHGKADEQTGRRDLFDIKGAL